MTKPVETVITLVGIGGENKNIRELPNAVPDDRIIIFRKLNGLLKMLQELKQIKI